MSDDPATSLLVMDFQNQVVDRLGTPAVIAAAGAAVSAARAHGVLVVYVTAGFRPGYPEVSPANRMFATATAAGAGDYTEATRAMELHPTFVPEPDEPVVVKRRVSAFAGSDLEVLLRSQRIETLVLAGIATSGVVLSTLREAADRDFRLIVLSDACADRDDEVHRVLLEKVYPRQADVLTVGEWAATLTG